MYIANKNTVGSMARRVVKVLLFKSEKPKDGRIDSYRQAFEVSNLSCVVRFTPVLGFAFNETGLQHLRNFLQSDDACAIVLTSPRASEALASALRESSEKSRVSRRVYCVGVETSTALAGYGLDVVGADAGSATKLGQEIVECGEKRVVFLCGDKRRDELPKVLTENSVTCTEIVVYQSILLKNVEVPKEFIEQDMMDDLWLVFFSPSGVECICGNRDMKKLLMAKKVIVAAIGKTTAAAVRNQQELGTLLHAVASKPTAKSLVQCIEKYYSAGQSQ